MENNILEIIEFTDPACTWCWGSEPILRKLKYRLDNQVNIRFVMGGLVEDAHTFMDPRNNIGGDLKQFNKQVAQHWLEASMRHGMPVEAEKFKLFDDDNPSTYPMNIAFKAAQMQNEDKAIKFLRRMREAIAAEAKQVNRIEVLIGLAQECGLNISEFISDMSNDKAKQAFKEDKRLTTSYKATGFPSFLLKNRDGKEVLLKGYQTYENFISTLNLLSNGELVENKQEATEENILQFIEIFEKVTTVEIKNTFDLSVAEVNDRLETLIEKKKLTQIAVGNGFYYKLSTASVMCDV